MDYLRSGVQDQPDQYGEIPSLLKIQKFASSTMMVLLHSSQGDRMWWCVHVIPATQEAEIGEWLESRRQMLQ